MVLQGRRPPYVPWSIGLTYEAQLKMKEHYGRGSYWVRIWRKNEKLIPDFDRIFRGQRIIIPKE